MTKSEILTKVEKYFENEYKSLCHSLKYCDWTKTNPQRFIHQSMASCVGIVMFCQDLGVEYEPLDALYQPYYEKMFKMLRDYH